MTGAELIAIASKLMNPGDMNFVVNSTNDKKDLQPCPGKLFNHKGVLLHTWQVLTQGVNGPSYKVVGGDTVEGIYAIEYILITTDQNATPADKASYGPAYAHLGAAPGLANPQTKFGRAGQGIHGQTMAKRQPFLSFTKGCIRMFNDNLMDACSIWDGVMKRGNKVLVVVDQD